MLIKKPADIKYSETTPEREYREFRQNRREFLASTSAFALLTAAGCAAAPGSVAAVPATGSGAKPEGDPLYGVIKSPYSAKEPANSFKDITHYNNFYEFGTDKSDPARNSGTLRPRPWTLTISGLVKKPVTLDLDAVLKVAPLEERIYRLRCVEAWSMVIPWIGYSLSELLKKVEVLPSAKYVEFTTLMDPKQMPGQRSAILNWPYREGLRLDEAMHPLTILCSGLYGVVLPNQNGAPLRLVVPWKYGFKSGKSIDGIRLTAEQPRTAWNDSAPNEYGFYSNVNPQVDHPRWTQATERRIGEFLRRPTAMFNGYADQVGSMYTNLDLKKNF